MFAFAHDLGSVGSTAQSRVIALGHARDPAVQYIIANNGRQDRSLFFFSQFATARDAVGGFSVACLSSVLIEIAVIVALVVPRRFQQCNN